MFVQFKGEFQIESFPSLKVDGEVRSFEVPTDKGKVAVELLSDTNRITAICDEFKVSERLWAFINREGFNEMMLDLNGKRGFKEEVDALYSTFESAVKRVLLLIKYHFFALGIHEHLVHPIFIVWPENPGLLSPGMNGRPERSQL